MEGPARANPLYRPDGDVMSALDGPPGKPGPTHGEEACFASVALFLLFERSSGTGRQPRGPEDATIPARTPPLDGHADDRARDFVGAGRDLAEPAGTQCRAG